MEAYTCCQSCGMPINRPEWMGTEKDHSKSTIYCTHCYRDGEFTNPDITIAEMKAQVRQEFGKAHASESIISSAVNRLTNLSRWMGIPAIQHCCEWH
jgi:Putative zinc ribbon domain